MSVTTAENHHVEAIIDLLQQWADHGGDLTVDSGETHTVDSGDTDRYATVSNGGTVENQGTLVAGVDVWGTTPPNVRSYWDDAQNEKGPGADQPAVIYVWSPVDSTLERFSIDDGELRENNTVEIQIWTLDEQEAVTLSNDIVEILSKYMADNKDRTPYAEVQPSGLSDFREQKNARMTNHYIMSVEIDTDGLITTGLA